jgi:MFS family permease
MPLLLKWDTDREGHGAHRRGRHYAAERPLLTISDAVDRARASGVPTQTPSATRRPALHLAKGRASLASVAPRPGRAFNFLLAAGSISSVGDGLAFVAFPLLASTLTRNPGLIAGVAIAARLPWLLVALPAGALADRLDRRRLLGAIEVGRMLVLLLLGLSIATSNVTLVQIYLAAFVLGSFETGFVATTQAVLPEVVPAECLGKSNGRLLAAQMTGEQFLGPALGGIVFAFAAALPFVADGISFAASAALLTLALPRRRASAQGQAARILTGDGQRRSIYADIREGLAWLRTQPALRLIAGLIAAFALCQTMGLAVLVVYGLRVLHLSGSGFGVFVALGAVGTVAGGLVAHRVVDRLGTGRVLLLAGLVAGVSIAGFGLTSSLVIAEVAFILEAVAVGVGNVAALSLRQSLIPSHLGGRVAATLRMCISGAAAVGGIVGGVMATAFGVRSPYLLGGILQAGAALVIGIPLIRCLSRLPGTPGTLPRVPSASGDVDALDVEEWVNGDDDEEVADVVAASTDVA